MSASGIFGPSSPAMEHPTTYTWKDVCAERSRRQKAVRVQKKVGSKCPRVISACRDSTHPPPRPSPSISLLPVQVHASALQRFTDRYWHTCMRYNAPTWTLQHRCARTAKLNTPVSPRAGGDPPSRAAGGRPAGEAGPGAAAERPGEGGAGDPESVRGRAESAAQRHRPGWRCAGEPAHGVPAEWPICSRPCLPAAIERRFLRACATRCSLPRSHSGR